MKRQRTDKSSNRIRQISRRSMTAILLLLVFVMIAVFCVGCRNQTAERTYQSIKDLTGKRIGILSGTIFDKVAIENIPDCSVQYYQSYADLMMAISKNKISAFITDQPLARKMMVQNSSLKILEQIDDDQYGYIFPETEWGKKLSEQMNEFLARCGKDGTLQQIDRLWFGTDAEQQVVDMSGLSGENGTLDFAISTLIGEPFLYMKDGKPVGYEVDIVVRFARQYGYDIRLHDSTFAGVLASISAKKSDIGAGSISITEERKQSMYFSDPHYIGGIVAVTDNGTSNEKNSSGISKAVSGIAESFNKTFLREDRWKLFVYGIGITILITLLSTIFGSLLGFGIYMLYRKNCKPFVLFADIITDIFQKTPTVVILMILFYIIFGSSRIDSVWVAVIGFTTMFAFSCVGIIRIGVAAVDKGQREASLALGFTDTGSFLKVIFPQATRHFLPVYKNQIITLLKETAIVGYIAVQDLTKVGDIVRSRTYEAFFPLFVSTIIYFILAWLITLFVRRIEFKIIPEHRSWEKIIEGVTPK